MVALLEVSSFLLSEIQTSLLGVRQFFKLSHEGVESLSVWEDVQVFLGDDRAFHIFELLLFLLARCSAHCTANDLQLNQIFPEDLINFLKFFAAHRMIVQ